uniref:AIG1-type G domain-containing protein n=1 Tax=Erpetoichthys calabaricus TaxID=27687 RepID=A0A8C4SJV6_ERPCA
MECLSAKNGGAKLPPAEERRPRVASGPDLRIILGGKAGVGKSTAISTILGADEPRNEVFSASPVKEVEKRKGMVQGRHVSIIDTPGLLDKKLSVEEVKSNIGKCYSLSSPGPHVFLLVLKVGQFSKEESDAIKIIQNVFGDRALSYTMILFTHGDNLRAQSVDSYLERSSKDLQEMYVYCEKWPAVYPGQNPHTARWSPPCNMEVPRIPAGHHGHWSFPSQPCWTPWGPPEDAAGRHKDLYFHYSPEVLPRYEDGRN